MPVELPLRCTCGAMTGVVRNISPTTVNRVACHCKSCTGYLMALDRADDGFDALGGTDLFQMSPRHLELTEGLEHLACMRMTPKGPLRWYAGCCKTPIANTPPSPAIAFMTVHQACIDWTAATESMDALLGPVLARVHLRLPGQQAVASRATRGALFRASLRIGPMLLGWWLRGDHRRWAFFDDAGIPIRRPQLHAK